MSSCSVDGRTPWSDTDKAYCRILSHRSEKKEHTNRAVLRLATPSLPLIIPQMNPGSSSSARPGQRHIGTEDALDDRDYVKKWAGSFKHQLEP
jgi:hypothetical protein